jgi:hypothetical protein
VLLLIMKAFFRSYSDYSLLHFQTSIKYLCVNQSSTFLSLSENRGRLSSSQFILRMRSFQMIYFSCCVAFILISIKLINQWFFGVKNPFRGLFWWRRRELNPRPSVLCRRLYMLSSVIVLIIHSPTGRARKLRFR